ncbi:unnamed protein product [Mytilus coruscus]|uniref:Uncharacterized protein n=1 Tax=Mytilus coruscus TaxID=42192 RepID=A0A6J8BW08_MYTCO|nr:unnamed protein product [Mytilus coruscus]
MFGCPPRVGLASSPIPNEMLATLQQEEDLNFEMTNIHHGLVNQSSNEDLVAPVSQFLTSVNQNSAISRVNSLLPDIHPVSETSDSQPTSEISNSQPTSETQDSQQISDVEASLLNILIPQAQNNSVEDQTPYEVHGSQYERECNKCSAYFQTDSTLQICYKWLKRIKASQPNFATCSSR